MQTIPLNVLSICFLHLNCVIIPSETLFHALCVLHSYNCHLKKDFRDFSPFTSSRLSVAFLCCRTLKGNINDCIWGLEAGICLEQQHEIDGSAVFRLPCVGCALALRWCFPFWRTNRCDDALSEITVTEVNEGKNTRHCQQQQVRERGWRDTHKGLAQFMNPTKGCITINPFDNFAFLFTFQPKVSHRERCVNVKGISCRCLIYQCCAHLWPLPNCY